MLHLASIWEERNRTRVLLASGAIALIVAMVDWRTKAYLSLGLLYTFPIMLAAGFLSRWAIAWLGLFGAVLSALYSPLEMSFLRLALESLALGGGGLFVGEWQRNRRLSMRGEARLRALMETSPAAIVMVGEHGLIELANRAAIELVSPRDGRLAGSPISAFFPDLHHALQSGEVRHTRTSIECRGHRGNGEFFLADVWCSTYNEGLSPKLAVIVAKVAEATEAADPGPRAENHNERAELNDREREVLGLLVQGLANKAIAACMDLSESKVRNTLQQLFAKSKVRTRAQLVKVALDRYRDLLPEPARAPGRNTPEQHKHAAGPWRQLDTGRTDGGRCYAPAPEGVCRAGTPGATVTARLRAARASLPDGGPRGAGAGQSHTRRAPR